MENTIEETEVDVNRLVRHCADLIQKEVRDLNAYSVRVSPEEERKRCVDSAKKVHAYLRNKYKPNKGIPFRTREV